MDELAAYKQVVVSGGATTTTTLNVLTENLGFIGRDNIYIVEPGTFGLRVQDQSTEFELMIP